ncbi:putative Histone-lysine N-methyltransferase SETD1 [Blattamonas nauphoetae]|uniref:[histone H3]-lysine(4) N-trimethyltransferase n=1 Tax=Blattamonas nauphoetae TaxID=2049346 RepID=A0ABQ9YHK6_9EUKA|nr:putative Histone-lysine N-methyltransferase SETD1 [Blattamonas nauphoetae]
MSHSPSRSMKSDKNSHYERTVSQRGDRNEYALISDPRDREKLFSIPFVETTKPTEMEPKVELHNMEQRSEARHEPRTEQRYDSRTEQRHEPRTEQKHESRTEQRYDPRTEQRHEPRSEQRYEPKAEQRHEPRTEQRHEMHTEPSFEARFEPKIEYKMESRTEQTSDRYVDRSIEMHEQLSRSPGEVQRASDFNMDSFNLNLSEALEKKMESRKKRNLYDGTLTIDAGLRLLERDAVKQKQAKSAPPNGVISHGIRIENRIHGRNEIRQFEDMNATQRMEAMKLVLRTRFFEKLGQSITEILVQKKDLSERETEIEQEIEQIQHEEEMEQEREREKAEEEERERREREIASKVKADKIREKRRELEQKKEMKREKAREREREKARAKEQARQENKKGRPRTEDNEREDNDEKKEPIGLHYKTERSEMLRDRDTSTESGVRDEMGTSESSTDNKKDQDYIQNGKKKKLKVSRELSGLLMSEKVKGGRSRKLTKKELRLQSLEEEDEERETGRRVFTEHEEGAETYRRGVTEYGSDDESSGFLSTPNGTPSFSRIVEVGDQISPSNSPNRKGVSQATFSDLEKGRIGRPVGSGKKVIEPDDDSVGEDGDDWMREDKGAKKEGKSKAERLSTSRRPHKNTHDRLKTPRIGSGRVSQATQRARAEYRRQQEFMEPLHFRFLVKDTDEEDLRDDKLALVVAAENAGLPLEDLFPDVVQQLGVGNRPDMSSVYEMPYALNLFMRDKKLLDRESARHRSNSSRRRLTLGAGKKKDSQMSLNKVLPYANAKIDWTSLDYDALERYRDHQVIQAIDEEKFVPMNEDMEPPFVTPPPGMPMYFSGSSVPLNTIEHLRQFVLAHPTHPFMSIPSFDPTRHMSMELGEFVGMLERRREEMIEDLRDRLMRDLRPDEQMGQRKKLDDEVMKPIEDPPMQPLLAEVENEVGPTLQPSTFSNFTSVFPRKWNALTWPTGENTEIDNQITRILQKRAFTPDSIPRNTTPPQSRTSSPVPRSTSNRSTPRPHISERRRLEQIKQEAQSSCQRCRPFTLNMCRGMLLKQFEDPVLVYSPTFESLTGPQSYLFNQGPQTSRPDGEFVVDQERNKTVKGGSEPFIEYLPLGSGIPKHPEGKFFSPTAMVVGYSSTDKGTPAPPIIHPSATSLSLRQMPVAFERSKIHDWGLYAMVDIEERHVVVEYVGEVIRSSVAQKRENLYIQQGNPSSYLFQVDPYCIIDATKTGNNARYINHSCDPNCFAEIINDDGVRKVVIFAKRKIYMGEEITYDYKFSDEPEETKVKCTCGAPNCKRTLN